MGRSLIAAAGSVPAVGERVCDTTLIDDYLRAPASPAEEIPGRTAGRPRVARHPARSIGTKPAYQAPISP